MWCNVAHTKTYFEEKKYSSRKHVNRSHFKVADENAK